MLPQFLVVGAQKCGTTSLHSYLDDHPDICLPSGKETKFFVDDRRYIKGLEYYQDHWPSDVTKGQLLGEVDPDYMYFDVALERMASVLDLKNTKIIFVFREPVSRAFSHYLMSYRRGIEQLGFEDAIAAEPARICKGYYERMHYSYLDRGHYYQQVLRFLDVVKSENIFFALSEDLSDRTQEVMTEILHFLGVSSSIGTVGWEKKHTSSVPRSPRLTQAIVSKGLHKDLIKLLLPFPTARQKLREFILNVNQTDRVSIKLADNARAQLRAIYREDNEKLSELIGRDLSHWK